MLPLSPEPLLRSRNQSNDKIWVATWATGFVVSKKDVTELGQSKLNDAVRMINWK